MLRSFFARFGNEVFWVVDSFINDFGVVFL